MLNVYKEGNKLVAEIKRNGNLTLMSLDDVFRIVCEEGESLLTPREDRFIMVHKENFYRFYHFKMYKVIKMPEDVERRHFPERFPIEVAVEPEVIEPEEIEEIQDEVSEEIEVVEEKENKPHENNKKNRNKNKNKNN